MKPLVVILKQAAMLQCRSVGTILWSRHFFILSDYLPGIPYLSYPEHYATCTDNMIAAQTPGTLVIVDGSLIGSVVGIAHFITVNEQSESNSDCSFHSFCVFCFRKIISPEIIGSSLLHLNMSSFVNNSPLHYLVAD